MPMYFTVIDLIGKFKLLPQGHQHDALTVIDTLTNFTWYILLFTKEADEVVHTCLVHMYSTFDSLHKILLDNNTEFKNKLLMQADSTLGMKQVFSSTCYPLGNGHT